MKPGEIEFIADTLLLEKVVAASAYSYLQKNAGLADSIFGYLSNVFDTIKSEIKGLVDTSSFSSALSDVANLIMTGGLFTLWPPLGVIAATVESVYGLKLSDIAKKIWSAIVGKISSGTASLSDVSAATKNVALSIAGSPQEDTSEARTHSIDLFQPLREKEAEGQLFALFMKEAGFWSDDKSERRYNKSSSFMSFLRKINPFKGKLIAGGIVGWIIKAALIGAGLLTVSGTGAKLLGIHHDDPNKQPTTEDETQPESAPVSSPELEDSEPEEPSLRLTSTGRGQDKHLNDHKSSTWIVPLIQGSVEKTLAVWAIDVYDELAGHEQAIYRAPAFRRVVSEFAPYKTSNRTEVPPKYKSRKQVVDQFVHDVIKIISSPS